MIQGVGKAVGEEKRAEKRVEKWVLTFRGNVLTFFTVQADPRNYSTSRHVFDHVHVTPTFCVCVCVCDVKVVSPNAKVTNGTARKPSRWSEVLRGVCDYE